MTGAVGRDERRNSDRRPARRVSLRPAKRARRASARSIKKSISIPTMSVTENLTLGRQPRRLRTGLVARGARALRASGSSGSRSISTSSGRSAPIRWRFSNWSPSRGRLKTTRGCWCSTSRPPVSTPTRSALLFQIVRDLKAPRHRDRLHHPLPRPGLSDRRSDLGAAQRPAASATATAAELPRLKLISMMLGRELEETEERLDASPPWRKRRADPCCRKDSAGAGSWRRSIFRLQAGEVVGLAGLLGSGRTEVAKLIFGAIKPDSGRARGRRRRQWAPIRRAQSMRRGMAFCPEDRKAEGIFAELTVRENIVLGLQTKRGWLAAPLPRRAGSARERDDRGAGDCDAGRREAGRPILRRQSAEGRCWRGRWCRARAFSFSTSRRAASTSARMRKSSR